MLSKPAEPSPMKALTVLASTLGLMLSVAGCNWVELVSQTSDGTQGDGFSFDPSLSDDGRYIAFSSLASNFATTDAAHFTDIFVRDTADGALNRISVGLAGADPNGHSAAPAISAGGHFIAFSSSATNLVVGDTSFRSDIFVHEMDTGITTQVSVDSSGIQANTGRSDTPEISDSGRYVAFQSSASNLVPGDTNGAPDIFVHDRIAATTERVSVNTAGEQGNGSSFRPSISGDGRYVVFQSYSTNLVAGDNNAAADIFMHDRDSGLTSRLSVSLAGAEADNSSFNTKISSNGRYVVFQSDATNLVGNDTNGVSDIFLRDIQLGITERISISQAGIEADSPSFTPAISGDGRYVAFESLATNLVGNDSNGERDIYVRDRSTGSISRASLSPFGIESDGFSYASTLSGDGRYVAFSTDATNLLPNDENGKRDIYVRSIPNVTVTSVVPEHLPIGATTAVTITGTDFFPGALPWLNGAQKSNIIVVDENTITMDVTIPANKLPGSRDVGVRVSGTGPGMYSGSSGVCESCVTYQ